MNLREQKNDLSQPLLQEFKIDMNDQHFNNSDSAKLSVLQLTDLIKRIDNCVLILQEFYKLPQSSNRQLASQRRCRGHMERLFIAFTVLASTATYYSLYEYALRDEDRNDFGIIFIVAYILNLVIFAALYIGIKRGVRSQLEKSFGEIINSIDESEQQSIFDLTRELEINPYENSLDGLVKLFNQKRNHFMFLLTSGPCKEAFLMGSNLVRGAKSSVRTLFNNELFDRKVCGLFFQFAGFTELSKKEKAERVTTELKDIMFFTQAFDHERDERVLQEILSFMGLSDSELNAERMLGPGLSKM